MTLVEQGKGRRRRRSSQGGEDGSTSEPGRSCVLVGLGAARSLIGSLGLGRGRSYFG